MNEGQTEKALIVNEVCAFFGRSIAIEDRCFLFLSTLNEARFRKETLLQSLFFYDPSLLYCWQRAQRELGLVWIPSKNIQLMRWPDVREKPLGLNITTLLQNLFRARKSPGVLDINELTIAGDAIKARGILTSADFLFAYFDELWFDLDTFDLQEEIDPGEMWYYRAGLLDAASASRHQLELDTSQGNQLFIISLDGRGARIDPIGLLGGFVQKDTPILESARFRGNILESSRFSQDALLELQDLINCNAREHAFQIFFEHHPDLLLLGTGAKYKSVHFQIALFPQAGNTLIPDFFLERVDTNMCDILDLKRPNVQLRRLVRNRNRFRDAVMDVVAQLEMYRNYFEDVNNREEFNRRYGLKAYRPKVIAIMGRKLDYYQDIERIQIEGLLPSHFELVTYDDIVQRVQLIHSLMSKR